MDLTLGGEVALVTGASSGLGRRFAELLADAGAAVACAGRRVDRLNDIVAAIRDRGGRAAPVELDVGSAAACRAAIDSAEQLLGPLSILVNNAGIGDATAAITLSDDDIDQMWTTNVRGPFVLSCELARRLIERGAEGRIVNIASMSAYHYSGRGGAWYSTSKAAVVRLTETLAVEWASHGINVNAIAPGVFRTEILDETVLARLGDLQHFPRGRIGEPSQLDSTLLYLVSPTSALVTGTVVKVDDAQVHR